MNNFFSVYISDDLDPSWYLF